MGNVFKENDDNMSDIGVLTRLIESTKKDIITVVNARTDAIETQITYLNEQRREQKDLIDNLDWRVDVLEKTASERELTCLPKVKAMEVNEKTIGMINWIAKNKIIMIGLSFLALFLLQSLVYYIFSKIELIDIIKLIYK